MAPFLIGVFLEAVGYFLRAASARKPEQVGLYIGQTLPIILAPAFLAASVYMSYGRIIAFVGERHSPIRASRVTKLFVTFDVLSFFIQGAGGGLQSNSSSDPNLAKAVLIVGFVIQIISFGIFGVLAGLFHRRALRAGEPTGNWSKCLWTLYAGVALVTVRNVFRTVEFATSTSHNSGFILEHEGLYYALEALPIILCVILFLVSNPSRLVPQDMSARLSGGTAVGTPGYGQDYQLSQKEGLEWGRQGRWAKAVRSVGHRG